MPPTYTVFLTTTASTCITVEAEDEETAIDKAYNKLPYICAQCSGWGKDVGIELSGEWEVAEYGVEQVDP
jgi:hypothetical protein